MSDTSRISVEIGASSASLQEAVDKASEALSGLGDVLAKQTEKASSLSDKILDANKGLASSYTDLAGVVKETAASTTGSWSAQADASMTAGERIQAANDLIARAALGTSTAVKAAAEGQAAAIGGAADAVSVAADRQAASSARAADAYREQAAAAEESAAKEAEASRASADASEAAADATVASSEKSKAASAESAAAFGAAGSKMSKVGRDILLAGVAVGLGSLDMAAKWQASTLRIQTQAGATASQLTKLRAGMLNMAGVVGDTPEQLSTAMFHVVSSLNKILPPLHRVNDELLVTKIAAEGAQVGGSDLEDTTYALVSAMNALHTPVQDAGKVMGQLNAIVGAGDMTMPDLVDALNTGLIPSARESGVSLQSLGAAMSVMGDMGQRGAMAGTRLRMAIALLSGPSEAAAKILDTVGLSSKQATSDQEAMAAALQKAGLRTTSLSADLKKPDGIVAALEDLKSHLISAGLTATGAAAVMDKAFGGARSGETITELAQNAPRITAAYAEIGKTGSQFGHDWQLTSETFRVELDKMVASVEVLAIKLGNFLMPYATRAMNDLRQLADWFAKNKIALEVLGGAVATFATVTIGSYLFSKLRATLGMIKELGSGVSSLYGTIRKYAIEKPLQALTGTTPGSVQAGGAGSLAEQATGGVWGARGPTQPGSISNPIIVAMEAGEYAGLSSEGAAGTVATEQHVAQAETGAVEQETGTSVAAASGTAAAEVAAPALEGVAGAGIMASLKAGLPSVLEGAVKGGMIAVGGQLAAQLAGGLIGGKAGHDVASVGGDAAVGAGLGMLVGPEGAAVGGAAGALVGLITSLGSSDSPAQKLKDLTTQIQQAASDGNVSLLKSLGDQAATTGQQISDSADQANSSLGRFGAGFAGQAQQARLQSEQEAQAFDQLSSRVRVAVANMTDQMAGPLQSALDQVANYGFPAVTAAMDNTSLTVQQKTVTVVQSLQQIASQGTGPMAANAKQALDGLRATVTTDLQGAVAQATTQMSALKTQVEDGSGGAAKQVYGDFLNIKNNIDQAMHSGLISTQQGAKMIGDALNAAVKAFGGKAIPLDIQVATWSTSKQLTLIAPSNGVAAPLSAGSGLGVGGFVGSAGEKGTDTVHAILGRGEAVLKSQDQAIVNQALAGTAYGSLSGVFAATAGQKHWMADGGYAGAPIGVPKVSGPGQVAAMVQAGLADVSSAANSKLGQQPGSTAGGAGAAVAGITTGSVGVGRLVPGIMNIEQQAAKIAGIVWNASIVEELLSKESSGGVNEPPSGRLSATGPNQVIPGTFAEYALPGYRDINNPLDNAIASFRYIKATFGSLANMAAQVGLFGAGYVGYAGGGFVEQDDYLQTATTIRPPKVIAAPKTPKAPKPANAPKAPGALLSTKDMQALSTIGGQISPLEAQIANLTGTYQADSTMFAPEEAQPQFLNPDGSINAAGYAQKIQDDQTLLSIDQQLLALYKQEVPIITAALSQYLGSDTTISTQIAKDTLKENLTKQGLAADKQRIVFLRKQILNLQKPAPDTVTPIEDHIKQTELDYASRIAAAQRAKTSFTDLGIEKEFSLEGTILNAEKSKLSSSTLTQIDALKQQVLDAQSTEHAYTGTKTATKDALARAVDIAQGAYSQYVLDQAPIKAKAGSILASAQLDLRSFLQSEKPTALQLTENVQNIESQEKSTVDALEQTLLHAKEAQAARKQKLTQQVYGIRQQISSITSRDSRLTQSTSNLAADAANLKSILAGANGGTGTTNVNTTVALLETVAGKLGTVDWTGGKFTGIDTTQPGEIVSVNADILSLQNDIAASQTAATTAAATTADDSQLITLLEEQNAILAETVALGAAQTSVLAGMIPSIPSYDTGGPILEDQLAHVHEGEYVVPKGGALVASSSGSSRPPVVQFHQHLHGSMPALAKFIDQRIQHPSNVQAVSRQIGRRSQLLAGTSR